jgi:hypothetical protein
LSFLFYTLPTTSFLYPIPDNLLYACLSERITESGSRPQWKKNSEVVDYIRLIDYSEETYYNLLISRTRVIRRVLRYEVPRVSVDFLGFILPTAFRIVGECEFLCFFFSYEMEEQVTSPELDQAEDGRQHRGFSPFWCLVFFFFAMTSRYASSFPRIVGHFPTLSR